MLNNTYQLGTKRTELKSFSFWIISIFIPLLIPGPTAAQVNMTYSFMQLLSTNQITLRNIKKSDGKFYRENYSLDGSNWLLIPGTSHLEGTNQRKYFITDRTITIDGDKSDWGGISAAFSLPRNNNIPDPGTNVKEVYLAKDQTYLYVLMTLHGPPVTNDTITYFFQARLLPNDVCFSYYTGVRLNSSTNPEHVAIHYRPNLTITTTQLPIPVIIAQYQNYAASGYDGATGVVEWKIPLSVFPLEAIIGRCVDAWIGNPPNGGMIDSTPTNEGVYMDTQETLGLPGIFGLLLGE
ncbi:MAG: hypothetical protein FJ121_12205 [Deltaproteobacteria bacterium]|nr:hypothetical protein [Deltaproteobacteria bacterium]